MTAPLTILGGGPAGLAVAFYATRAGIPFRLYERSDELGGLCRTFRCGPHRYDSGAHRFHDRDAEVTRDIRALLGDSLRPVTAPSQIVDGERFIEFPPTPLGLLRASGAVRACRIACELAAAKVRGGGPPRSFAEHAERRFGRFVARRYLLDYSEKLWGLPADRLSPDVATRRLDGMSVRSLIAELFRPSEKARHIDGDFLYPRDGYGAIAEALGRALPEGSVSCGAEVRGIELDGGRVVGLDLGERRAPVEGRVVSTIPLTGLARMAAARLRPEAIAAAGRLRFRHVRLVFLRLGQDRVGSNASIYVPDPARLVARVTEPKNRSEAMAPPDETALVAEVPCFEGSETFSLPDAALAARVVEELAALGLLRPARVIETRHHLLRNAYPVYDLDYPENVAAVADGLAALENVDTLGRVGTFFYSHLHDQMRFARDYVAALGAGAPRARAAAGGRA